MRIHSLLSPKCRVQRSEISGLGVFAVEALAPRELVAVWGGKVRTSAEVSELTRTVPHAESHALAVCEGYYLTTENFSEFDDTELFNHSCEPNVGVQGQIVLVARRAIAAGEELTFDYGTTEFDAQPWPCRCGTPSCRGTIDGNDWKNPAFVEKHREFLSWYILERMRK